MAFFPPPAWATCTATTPRSDRFCTGFVPALLRSLLRIDLATFFPDRETTLAADRENVIVLANPVLPHSEGEIVIESQPTRPGRRQSA